jgi:hypothetical protein
MYGAKLESFRDALFIGSALISAAHGHSHGRRITPERDMASREEGISIWHAGVGNYVRADYKRTAHSDPLTAP